MRVVKQSTARSVVVFMTDSSDHVTGKTGLTLTITASKDGGSFASVTPTVTELATGWYKLALTTAHTDTLGDLALHITGTGCDPADLLIQVVAYDMASATNLGLSGLPTANPGAANGIFIAGSNAATTISGLTTGALSCTTITASGAVAFQSTFAVTTSTSLAALSCTTLTASGAVAFQSTFAVTTSTSLGALSCTTLTASGAVAFQSTFAVTTSTSLAALSCTTLTASGAVAFQSTFATTGTTTFNAFTVTNALTVSGTTTLTGAVTASNASNNIVGIDVAKISGDATAADNAESFFDGTGYAGTNNVIPLVTTTTTATNLTNAPTSGDLTATMKTSVQVAVAAQAVTIATNVRDVSNASPAAGSIGEGINNAASRASTIITTLGSAGAGLSAIPWNAAWDAEVQSEVQDAIEVNNLDHLLAVAAVAADAVDSSIIARMTSKSATPSFASFVNTTDSLEALRDRGDAAWITATGFSTHTAADVWAVATRVLTAGTNIALAKGTGVTGFNDIAATAIVSNGAITTNGSGKVSGVVLVDTCSVNSDMRGTDSASLAATALSTAVWTGSLATNLGTLASHDPGATIGTSTLTAAQVLTTALTEGYAADGAAFTLAQGLYMIFSAVGEFSISGTTLTCKKLDGSTTSLVYTLNDATSPTSRTRSA